MQLKIPKNTEKYFWTQHAIYKMKQYGLSPQRVIRVIRNPERIEKGIAPKTIAVMQRASQNKKSGEIWCMYQVGKSQFQNPNFKINPKSKNQKTNKLKIISAWRYPGISPKNNPVPEEILREIASLD